MREARCTCVAPTGVRRGIRKDRRDIVPSNRDLDGAIRESGVIAFMDGSPNKARSKMRIAATFHEIETPASTSGMG